MDSKNISMLILCLILGGSLGFFGGYSLYTPIINEYSTLISTQETEITKLYEDLDSMEIELDTSKTDLQSMSTNFNSLNNAHESLISSYDSLETEHATLLTNYADVTELYKDLIDDYYDLENDYENLDSTKRSIEDKYSKSLDYLSSLSNDVLNFQELIGTYTNLEESFSRILCEDEVDKIASTVTPITDADDVWDSYEDIYHYVNNNVEYEEDPEIPCIYNLYTANIDGNEYVTSFSTYSRQNTIQTPFYTLENKQGDCDDHAVLIYAMLKYYLINVYGTNYRTYIMRLEFSEDIAHLAVLIPVADGNLCILDSAGNYFTSRWGHIASKTVSLEFENYSDHLSEWGEITHITLYDIDIFDGTYDIDAEGTLEEIISFLES